MQTKVRCRICFRFVLGFMALFLSSTLSSQTTNHILSCGVSGPDSVFFDKTTFNRYLPGEFDILIVVVNEGTSPADSVYAFPRSNPRFTIVSPASVLLTDRFLPGDTLRTAFTLRVNPRMVSGLDTIIVAISGKEGARTECLLVVWVEKEYRPVNVLSCPPVGSVSTVFEDTLNDYLPNPVTFTLNVENIGDAPSRETRLIYVATEGLSLADGQPQTIEIGELRPGGSVSRLFRINVIHRRTDTVVTVRFRVQGKGGLNDRIIDTLCSYDLFIPAVRDVLFELACVNDPGITFENGSYTPNPFTWQVRIRNTGTSLAKNVRATLTHPPSVVVVSPPGEILVGDLKPGEETVVTWILRALPVFETDTSQICVLVFDTFNRRATCCDSLILPAVRAPSLEALCTVVPDSIRVNTSTGLYQPTEFFAELLITNIGTDPADSVFAEVIIADPNIAFVSPTTSRVFVSSSFLVNSQQSIRWTLAPLPDPMARDLEIIFRVTGRNTATISTRCAVHIDAALKPSLECTAGTNPDDTLHYSIATLEYDQLTFTATVRNNGSVAARDLEAAVLLPSGLGVPSTGTTVLRRSTPLEVDSLWTVSWTLLPVSRRHGTLDTIRVEFRSGSLKSYCDDWIFIVGIPPVTVFTIPRYALERYGREVTVPILIDESHNKDIREITLHVLYNENLLALTSLETDSTLLAEGWSVIGANDIGRLTITASSLDKPLQGIGELVRMRFKVLFGSGPDILRHAGTLLEFDSLASSVNRGSVLARFYDGYVTVSGDCLYPLSANENFVIFNNRPNPFNPSTIFSFELRRSGRVTIQLLDYLGRLVDIPYDELRTAGTHEFEYHANTLSSGQYQALLLLDGVPAARRRLVLLR